MDDYGVEKPRAIPALGHFPKETIITGTTLVAVQYKDGVVFGTDSRTSSGSFVDSRATDKITPITDHIVVCRSGVAADTQAIADIGRHYVDTYSIIENKKMSIYRAAQIFRNFFYNYREEMMGSVIIGGYDAAGPQIYEIPLGGYTIRREFAATGSGSTYVTGFLDEQWKPDMSLEDIKQLVKMAVYLATVRDGSSGGVIRLATVNKSGTHRELFLPERFPVLNTPKFFSMFPSHVEESGPSSDSGHNSSKAKKSEDSSEESEETEQPNVRPMEKAIV